jgi:hypothetical protein
MLKVDSVRLTPSSRNLNKVDIGLLLLLLSRQHGLLGLRELMLLLSKIDALRLLNIDILLDLRWMILLRLLLLLRKHTLQWTSENSNSRMLLLSLLLLILLSLMLLLLLTHDGLLWLSGVMIPLFIQDTLGFMDCILMDLSDRMLLPLI